MQSVGASVCFRRRRISQARKHLIIVNKQILLQSLSVRRAIKSFDYDECPPTQCSISNLVKVGHMSRIMNTTINSQLFVDSYVSAFVNE